MKKHIALLLSVIMIFTSFIGINVQAEDMIFIDPADETYLKNLTNLGIFPLYSDEGFFDGTKEVTRAEAAIAIAGLLNMGQGTSASIGDKFVDVLPTEPASGAISFVHGIGAMGGFGDNLFRPYDAIEEIHFVKAIMVALGYNWKASISGGYPNGYIVSATAAGVLENVQVTDGKILTRSVLLKILNNALEVPVYDFSSISGEQVNLEINEDVNVLTKYHHIYKDTAVVNSNSMTSLNSAYSPEKEAVLIGNRLVYLNGDKSIYTHIGENVTYYYKQADSNSKPTLVNFVPFENSIAVLNDADIISADGGVIKYELPDDNKEKRMSYTASTQVIYNGGRGGVSLSSKLMSFSGTVKLINNNGDNAADVVIINDYVYDEVYSVDAASEKIYFKSQSVNLLDKEGYVIESSDGKVMSIDDVEVGAVYAIAISGNGNLVSFLNLTSSIGGTVSEISANGFVIDGTAYKTASSCDPTAISKVELNSDYTFVLNSSGLIVYIKEGKDALLNIGYLMDYGTMDTTFDSTAYLKIMTAGGGKEVYELDEKIKINNEPIDGVDAPSKLIELKNNLNLASDGRITQVIRFALNSKGLISDIYTALLEENDYLQLKFNSEGENASLRDHGYGVGAFKYKYLVGNKTTFFRVPASNQDTYEDDYFMTFRYQDEMEDGDSYTVETYCIGDEVYPSAAVYYDTAVAGGVHFNADLFLVDKVSQSVNTKGDEVTKFTGFMLGKMATYESVEKLDVSSVSKGDALVFEFTPLDEIKSYKLVYDVSENKINDEYYNEDISQQKSVTMFSVYKRKGDFMEATPKDFSDMDLALDNMYGLNFSRISSIEVYDSATDKTSVTTVDSIIDYIHAGNDCTKMLVRYMSGYMMNVIIYK